MDFYFLPATLTLNALSALCAHTYFHRNEGESLTASIFFLLLVPILQIKLLLDYYPLLLSALVTSSVYYITLLVSIVGYRLSPLHPLYHYPGPLLCKFIKWTGAWVSVHEETHRWTRDLHIRYGRIVRTGPNELSIIDKDLIPFILGSQGMPRGPIWDGRRFGERGGKVYDSLINSRDQEEHARLRRPWNRAFSAVPVKNYEMLLIKRVKELMHGLEQTCLKSTNGIGKVDLARWVSFLAFDFMGDLAFGGFFNTVKEGDSAGFIEGMYNAMVLPNFAQHVPWILPFLKQIPAVNARTSDFMQFAQVQVQRRLSSTSVQPDLFHYMIEAAEETDFSTDPESLMIENATLAIVAGSDTTASVMSNVFYYLMRHPRYFKRLQEEIDATFSGSHTVEPDELTNLSFLNAVLNETLRLQPAVPTYLNRAPSKGSGRKMLGKSMCIPEGTSIVVSPYAMHRDSKYFSPHPNDFWPERWLQGASTKPSSDGKEPFVLAKDAFIPFSVGPANCAGKPMALIEMRLVVTNVVRRFDLAFDGNYDPEK